VIEAVLLDFGGVFTLSPFVAAREASEELGMDTAEAMELVFGPYAEDTDHPWHRVERGELTLGEYRDAVRAGARSAGFELDPMEVLARIGRSGGGGVIREDVVEATRRARAAGKATALVTNNALELRDLWRPLLPLDELFDVVVDSSEEGVRKPSARIYELTLERLGGVAAAAAVFLDDAEGNVVAARALGMHAILVEPDHRPALAELDALLGGG
jgi:putative hydrolase of the HAD superfamily